MRIIEKSVFLRPLNYVRVRHSYWLRFNIVVPAAFTAMFCWLIFQFSDAPNLYGVGGLIDSFTQLLGILAPFFIASLAAVATFAANDLFDKKFNMAEALTLDRLEQGEWKTRALTVRQFLSLLFGYCGFVSLGLFLLSLIIPTISAGISDSFGPLSEVVGALLFVVYIFILAHMLTATVLGIYYLCDRMHR